MALSLDSISRGRARKAPRITLLGVEGVGKSTWAAGAKNAVFIPTKGEQGLDEIDCAKFPPVQTFGELIETLGVLYRDDHDFNTVIVDSASALEPLVWDHVSRAAGVDSIERVDGGYGKGYVKALDDWRELMAGLDALRDEKGMASILIGHVKTKEFNDPEADPYTTYTFDIQDKAANALYRWSDCVLFANFKKAAVVKNDAGFNKKVSRATGTGQRVLLTEKRPAHPGKNRYGLPYELPLDPAKFWALLESQPESAPAAKLAIA